MPKNNQTLFIVFFIVAIVAVWYFTRPEDKPKPKPNSSSTLPLGLGQPLVNKNVPKFTNVKSKFGEEQSNITTYLDGKTITDAYVLNSVNSVMTYPDQTPMPKFNSFVLAIGFSAATKKVYLKNDSISASDSRNMELLDNAPDRETFDTIYKKLPKNFIHPFTIYAITSLCIFGENLMPIINKCIKPESNCIKGVFPYVWLLANLLNIDLLNNESKTGNGWEEYKFNANITKNTDITPSDITFGKSVKSILLVVIASEITNGGASQLSVKVNGTDYPFGDTSWYDDRSGYNYNFNGPNLNYPITLNSLSISVTCPGTSVDIPVGMLLVVYA